MAEAYSRREPDQWENKYIDQLTYSINLFLITATGALGFCISQLLNKSETDYRAAFRIAAICLFISIVCGSACTIIRLVLFAIRKSSMGQRGGIDYLLGKVFSSGAKKRHWNNSLRQGFSSPS